jgi:hypothetical protein
MTSTKPNWCTAYGPTWNQLEKDRKIRAGALALLRSRGFSNEAERKWLQRHSPEGVVVARPRHSPL